MSTAVCRFCSTPLKHTFIDLGMSPLSNSYLKKEELCNKESFYPLHAYVCEKCFLVQLEEFETPDRIFSDYAYFSSFSESWLKHAEQYTQMISAKLSLGESSNVIEIASNDGYLLQYFKLKNIPVLGIEPAANVAEVAKQKGIPTMVEFFGEKLANELKGKGLLADLIIGNNVLAHVPNINDFVKGLKIALKPYGTITIEFPHLLRLIQNNQFDTIYHEHFSYLSFTTVQTIFEAHGLKIFDVDELLTHGGSLRIYACNIEETDRFMSKNVLELLTEEEKCGFKSIGTYTAFNESIKVTKRQLLQFLIRAKNEGKKIAGYGAPAKGNTLLNFCGIRCDFIDFTVDRSPYKQGLYLPGTHIPVFSPEKIKDEKPDYVLLLPWNLKDEIVNQMSFIREWGGRFIIPIPQLEVI